MSTGSEQADGESAAALEEKSQAPYRDMRMEKGRAFAADHCQGRVLEIGCGNGRILRYLQDHGRACYGMDINRHAVALCHEKGVGAEVGNADALDQDERIDRLLRGGWDTLLFVKTFVYLSRPEEIIERVNPRRVVIFQSNPLYWRRTLCEDVQNYLSLLGQPEPRDPALFLPERSPFSLAWANWFKTRGYLPTLFAARPWIRWKQPRSAWDVVLSRGLGILFDRQG
ncbi:MAG: class I SAM-dependent methyltransferase [Magnetococcus sp. MYC-9]